MGVVVDRMGENNAAIANVMNTYYGLGDLPIGLEQNGVKDYSKVPDGYKLYRKLLAGQPDHSVNIVSVGLERRHAAGNPRADPRTLKA